MSNRGPCCDTCALRSILDQLVATESRCPHWLNASAGIIETNVATGEVRVVEGCSIVEGFRLMGAVIAASNRPAAAIESMRNDTINAMGMVVNELVAITQTVKAQEKLVSSPADSRPALVSGS